ncbi:MAG TPA: Na+/H+ antiporter subunit G [Candidatus Latescibacteria bacterium]|nr:Na+/H+ antiporter subunit G [Candidatus Latescibacterota bacterium]
MADTVGIVVITVGIAFDLFGCVGLVRFPDIYNRLQAATKCVTLGTCFILLGVLLVSGISSTGVKAILCLIFILLTSPTAAHALARGAHLFGLKLWEQSVCDKYEEEKRERR